LVLEVAERTRSWETTLSYPFVKTYRENNISFKERSEPGSNGRNRCAVVDELVTETGDLVNRGLTSSHQGLAYLEQVLFAHVEILESASLD